MEQILHDFEPRSDFSQQLNADSNEYSVRLLAKEAKERFARAITTHLRLSIEQKEQALYFLLGSTYPVDGYAIAQNYICLCLKPNYNSRGTGWRGKARYKPSDNC